MPVKRNRQSKTDRFHRQFATARIAMQHGAKRALRHLVLENAPAILIGVAGVNDQRQSGRACRRDMRAEAALLRFRRTVVVEIIQPGLTQRHHFWMLRQLDQFFRRDTILFIGVMGMRSDRAIDIGKRCVIASKRIVLPNAGRDRHHTADAHRFGTSTMASSSSAKSGKSR